MFEFRINFSSFLLLLLQFAAGNGKSPSNVVRDGDDVTLACEYLINNQNNCDATTWDFSDFTNTVELIRLGQIGRNAGSKSDRLNVTEKCSLIIKKVREEDDGFYTCKQYYKSGQQAQPTYIDLFVTQMTEDKHEDKVTFTCSVKIRRDCRHTVTWMYEGKTVNRHVDTLYPHCSDIIDFPTSDLKPNLKKLKCKVTDVYDGDEQLFPFTRQSSDPTEATTTSNLTERNNGSAPSWWVFVTAAAACAALLVTVLVVVARRRNKGTKPETKKTAARSVNPVVTLAAPGAGPDLIDAEDEVSYAPISFVNTGSSAQKQVKHGGGGDDDDEGNAVTYCTLKTSCSSAAASTDPSDLYATVKANKEF